MNLNTLQVLGRNAGRLLINNSPTILTGLGIGGLITTVAMAIKSTPKAVAIIKAADERREMDSVSSGFDKKPLSKVDIIKLTWKCYVPTALMGSATIFCMIGANTINLRRYAALAGLYELTETGLREYQAKVIETIGENKESKMREEMVQDKLNKNPVEDKQVLVTGKGEILCYESLSGRYFKSDAETIRQARNEFNDRLNKDMTRPLSEFYDSIGLPPTKMSERIGWVWEHGLMEIVFTSKLATNNEPCLVLEYKNGPRALTEGDFS